MGRRIFAISFEAFLKEKILQNCFLAVFTFHFFALRDIINHLFTFHNNIHKYLSTQEITSSVWRGRNKQTNIDRQKKGQEFSDFSSFKGQHSLQRKQLSKVINAYVIRSKYSYYVLTPPDQTF